MSGRHVGPYDEYRDREGAFLDTYQHQEWCHWGQGCCGCSCGGEQAFLAAEIVAGRVLPR